MSWNEAANDQMMCFGSRLVEIGDVIRSLKFGNLESTRRIDELVVILEEGFLGAKNTRKNAMRCFIKWE